MGEVAGRRVVLPDVRGNGRYLRVTWHPRNSTIVFSHWVEDVCVGSTQVELPQASKVVGLVVDALGEAISHRATQVGQTESARRSAKLVTRLIERFRTASAQIVALADRSSPAADQQAVNGP